MPRPLNKILTTLTERPLLVIFALFIIIQFILYKQIGVFTQLEAEKYITEGNLLFDTGRLSDSKYLFYLPVILLVYLCRWLHAPYGLVVIVQVALSALSLFYFYKLAKSLGNRNIAFFSAILLVSFLPLQAWNFFLYSDSIFISLTIIYTYVVYKQGDKGIRGTLYILLFLLLLLLSRPHGMLFIPPTVIYLVFRRQSRAQLAGNLAFCVILLAGMYFLLNAAFTGGGDMDAMKPFIEEHIICFVPLKPEGAQLDIIRSGSPVSDLFYYVFHNPLHFLRLMGLRLLSFFNMTRSYYSAGHNIFLALFLIPVYIFSLRGLWIFIKQFRNFFIFLFSLLVLYPLGATFQCDDWHSRFTMIIIPYVIILAVVGMERQAKGSLSLQKES